MSAAQAGRLGGDLAEVAARTPSTDADRFSGRISVQPRVLEKIAHETSASVVGVERGSISVQVAEGSKGVAVRLSTPLPVPDLDDTAAIRDGEPVLVRVGRIQEEVRDRVAHLIGRDVSRVDITITGAVIAEKRRVR
ncbi:Asp23/Gls24 family envelope stress response protein [Microbacterium pygmaeum]|uniref:Asp23 family, cell envelope-related function n=1 Tax=Microbacterium pygmaeum TaxID=370764 RepID=A0A1G7WLY8_9MICO|nr:hypothetical protein [Microbacterium pygmaeum]SDG73035.1 hypothetical protein SAMN04489810_1131 [Microbacterium pygmaeum]